LARRIHVDRRLRGTPRLDHREDTAGEDELAFTTRMFAWVASHPRTIGLAYFDKGWSGGSGIYELRSKRKSLALYRRAIRNARFLAALP